MAAYLGRANPDGVYDVAQNVGWVSVGTDHDTAAFAVESIRRWWQSMGMAQYPQARRLLITADGGGSNGSRVRLWKVVQIEMVILCKPLSGSLLNKAQVMLQRAGGGSVMSHRLACPAAPAPLEDFATPFDPLFGTLAQRRGFRDDLVGLLTPRERNKTLTALAGAEPIVGAQHPDGQRLQFFVSESTWDADALNARRLELAVVDPLTRPHDDGVLIIADTGDRKDGNKTDHVARHYLGSLGKIENGIVAVTRVWADERVYYPVHVPPDTPGERRSGGKKDPAFRTKPRMAGELIEAALAAGFSFRAVVADGTSGENPTFEAVWWAASVPFVVGLKPSKGIWAPVDDPHTPEEAAYCLRWGGRISKSGPTRRSDGTGCWSAAPSRFAGTTGCAKRRSPKRRASTSSAPSNRFVSRTRTRRLGKKSAPTVIARAPAAPGEELMWPRALRRGRAWLDPGIFLRRCWRAWSSAPPPPEIQALLRFVGMGQPLNLYLRV